MQHHEKTIELEFRAEIPTIEIEIIKDRLEKIGKLRSHT